LILLNREAVSGLAGPRGVGVQDSPWSARRLGRRVPHGQGRPIGCERILLRFGARAGMLWREGL